MNLPGASNPPSTQPKGAADVLVLLLLQSASTLSGLAMAESRKEPNVTNREKALRIECDLHGDHEATVDAIESALNAERKAGELDGKIKALEWAQRRVEHGGAMAFLVQTDDKLDRLRAEKAKLG